MRRNSATAAVVLVLLAGCTTVHRIDAPASQPKIVSELAIGDDVQIAAKSGATYSLEITGIQSDALIGVDKRANKRWKIPYREIERIDYKRLSTVSKVGVLGGGLVVSAYVTVVVLVLIVIATW